MEGYLNSILYDLLSNFYKSNNNKIIRHIKVKTKLINKFNKIKGLQKGIKQLLQDGQIEMDH